MHAMCITQNNNKKSIIMILILALIVECLENYDSTIKKTMKENDKTNAAMSRD